MRPRSPVGAGLRSIAQRFTEKLNLGRRETAILCVLMLRGPQTVGEIKGRTERLYSFADLDETETVLHKMMDTFVQKLPHAPGTKEPRGMRIPWAAPWKCRSRRRPRRTLPIAFPRSKRK